MVRKAARRSRCLRELDRHPKHTMCAGNVDVYELRGQRDHPAAFYNISMRASPDRMCPVEGSKTGRSPLGGFDGWPDIFTRRACWHLDPTLVLLRQASTC